MKKFTIFCLVIVIILCMISGIYINYKANYNVLRKENLQFERYLNKEIYGTELTTLINKVINANENNKIQKENGIYLNNNQNSINIEIKMTDIDKIYQMEKIYNGGIQNFVEFYGDIKFKCIQLEYHNSTNKVRYLLFEQISE
ncbi:MAG: hypothetical protein HFJ60_07235 [Clostridia bacterium]|nr:hypothetical protein [Clostridia bacterium]